MKNITETVAKKHLSQPNQTYYRGFTIERVVSGGKPFWTARRGNYQITKTTYKAVLSSINSM